DFRARVTAGGGFGRSVPESFANSIPNGGVDVARTVELALIGCGSNGRGHALRSRQIEGARVRAFIDVREAAARSLAAEFEGAYATTDLARALRDDAIEGVIISTHHDSHPSLAVAAATAGKHLLIEKPLALTVTECQRIEEAVARAGVRAMVGFKM